MHKGFRRGCPESRDDVTIVHGVLRLDACGKSQLRESRNVALLEHLGMLNGTMRMSAFGTIKHNGVRFIADGMTGDVEAMFDGESHVRLDLLRGIAQCAVGFRSDARIWHGTIGGTGVERASEIIFIARRGPNHDFRAIRLRCASRHRWLAGVSRDICQPRHADHQALAKIG